MVSKTPGCWRPVQNAPKITEFHLWSEEDHLILRRLQEKYSCCIILCDQLFGKTDSTETSTFPVPKMGPLLRVDDIQIKHEPLTPVCRIWPQNEQSVSVTSSIPGYKSVQNTSFFIKEQEFPVELKTAGEQYIGNYFPKKCEEGNKLFTPQPHIKTFSTKQKRLPVSDYTEKGSVMAVGETESQTDLSFLFNVKGKEQSLRSTIPSAARSRQITDCACIPWKSETQSSFTGFPCRISNLSPGSKKRNLLQTLVDTEEHRLMMECGVKDCVLYPGPENLHEMSCYNNTSELCFAGRISGLEKMPCKLMRTISTLPVHQFTSSPSVLGTLRPAQNLFEEKEDRISSTGNNVLGHEDTAEKMAGSAVTASDCMSKSVHSSLHLPTTTQHITSYITNCDRDSSVPSPANCAIAVNMDTLKTSEAREDAFQTSASMNGGEAALRTTTMRYIPSENDLPAESESHLTVKKAKRTSRERIQKKLTAYAGTQKKKPGKITETGSADGWEKEDPVSSTDRRHQKNADISKHGTEHGEESFQSVDCVKNISDMKEDHKQQLVAVLNKCSMIACMVLFEDGTTNSDSSFFTRPKVKGMLLYCKEKSYLFPVPCHCDAHTAQWSRNVLNSLLKKGGTVKVAINCKHFVIALLREFSLGDQRGALEWQFEDPIIAGWLLSPDSPPLTLHDLCKLVQVTYIQGAGLGKGDIGDELLPMQQVPPLHVTDVVQGKGKSPYSLAMDRGSHNELKMSVVVMEKLCVRLEREKLWPLFCHVEMALTPLLAAMELQAIRVNVHTFLTFSQVLKKKLDKVESKAYQLTGHPFCINSTQQLRQLLYEELKLDQQLPRSCRVTMTASTHRKSTSEAMLKQLVSIHPLPAVILEYRHLLKLKSTYIDGMVDSTNDGVLYTHWDQTSAATGRLVSSHPNLQAIPKIPTTITDYEDNFIVGTESKSYEIYAREPFMANEGNVFLAADFQQIELRLLAHLANDQGLKDMFCSNEKSADIFIQLTAQWLAKACEDVTHAEREQTKRVVYSILYGVGKERLAEYLKVSSSRAKDVMDSFLVSFPAIQVFTKRCIDYAQKHGYTETVMGRKRWLERVHHKAAPLRAQAERQAVNFCVQGSAADLCKRAMVRVEQALRNKKHLSARLLMQIHDELVWELPQDQLQEMCAITAVLAPLLCSTAKGEPKLVKAVMEDGTLLCEPLLPGLTVPITVSLSSGTSWAHLTPCH